MISNGTASENQSSRTVAPGEGYHVRAEEAVLRVRLGKRGDARLVSMPRHIAIRNLMFDTS